jgi:hypothetical protein
MARELVEPTYDEWLRWVFDHPARDRYWYHNDEADWWDAPAEPARATDYLTRLFDAPVPAVSPYSDAQISRGSGF